METSMCSIICKTRGADLFSVLFIYFVEQGYELRCICADRALLWILLIEYPKGRH